MKLPSFEKSHSIMLLWLLTLSSLFASVLPDCTTEIVGTGECWDKNDEYFSTCRYTSFPPNTNYVAITAAAKLTCLADINCIGYIEGAGGLDLLYWNNTAGVWPAAPPGGLQDCPGGMAAVNEGVLFFASDFDGEGCIEGSDQGLADITCHRKVNCTNRPTELEMCGGGGDPHIYRWGGGRFNYHGECDLVFVSARSFQGGTGLDLHVRTKIEHVYSIIEALAVKVGESVFEFNHATVGAPKYFANGVDLPELPYEQSPFKVTTRNVHNEDYNKNVQIIDIAMGTDAILHISVMDQWVHVTAKAKDIPDSKGLTGSFPKGEMLGRDGMDLSHDRNAYGSQWQVQPDEPQLFRSTPEGHPQAPGSTCKLPSVDAHQYLRTRNSGLYNMAVEACKKEGIAGVDLEDCIFDVTVMNNPKIAAAWWAMEHEEE